MNTLSSLLQWIGTTIGANPNTLKTSNKTLVGAINEMTSMIYPVGCYFWTSSSSFNPATAFGGSWEKLNEGITLVSAGNTYTIRAGVAKDGGEATHLLTSAESGQRALTITGGGHEHTIARYKTASSGDSRWTPYRDGTNWEMSTLGGGAHSHSVAAANAASAHNNMPPYKAAYCWHRTA